MSSVLTLSISILDTRYNNNKGRGAPPLITADTLEPAKEGLHFFMNPQVMNEL